MNRWKTAAAHNKTTISRIFFFFLDAGERSPLSRGTTSPCYARASISHFLLTHPKHPRHSVKAQPLCLATPPYKGNDDVENDHKWGGVFFFFLHRQVYSDFQPTLPGISYMRCTDVRRSDMATKHGD